MFTPFLSNSAVNSNVSAVTLAYLNPPVSVIIPVTIQLPISASISISKMPPRSSLKGQRISRYRRKMKLRQLCHTMSLPI